jgi:predicted transcriptional regulator
MTTEKETLQPMDTPPDQNTNDSLADAVRDEHEYLVKRLRDELQREPTEAELDEWLRQHTEGY